MSGHIIETTETGGIFPTFNPIGVATMSSNNPPTLVKVSAKWMVKQHNCTLSGIIDKCGGRCCYGPKYWPASSFAGEDNPTHACGYLGESGCTLSEADRPVKCLLYPSVISKHGTLVLHHRTQMKTSCCAGNHGNGPPLIESIATNLVALFGEEQYTEVLNRLEVMQDGFFDMPPDVADAYAREQAQEEANERPVPRTMI